MILVDANLTIATTDRDFMRFPEVELVNPVESAVPGPTLR